MSDTEPSTVWRPTPKFVLRSACVREATAEWEPGRFIEFGAGTGTMTRAFLERGFTGVCNDITAETRQILRANLAGYGDRIDVVDSLEAADEDFDHLLSFEVLEHIEDHVGALREWTTHLRPDGQLVISVPAHQRKYGQVDASVGHVRRYERAELHDLLTAAGYEDIRILNYGFPLGNATRIAQNVADKVRRRHTDADDRSYVERSVDSGVKSSTGIVRIAPLVNERTLASFVAVQRRFYDRELGDGFVATARKPAASTS